MKSPIPYGKQQITAEDINEVTRVLQSDFLTQGPEIPAFEAAFAAYIGAPYAVAVANGTAALHLAVLALGLKPGQKVICPPISFAASANCIRYAGGEVVFADIMPWQPCLDAKAVEACLQNAKPGEFAGIVAVSFAGYPIDLEPLRKIADAHGLWILEDSCHAPGAYRKSKDGTLHRSGDCSLADAAIFSFHPVKHIACGEGGMVTVKNEALHTKVSLLRTHGITRDISKFKNPVALAAGTSDASEYPGWYMEMQELGYNFRLSDILAALGKSQLSRAEAGFAERHRIANRYYEAFAEHPSICLYPPDEVAVHAYHLFVIAAERRLELYQHLKKEQIFAQVHYVPIHLMPYYAEQGWKAGDFPVAEAYYRSCLSLPMYPSLTVQEQDRVIQAVLEFYSQPV